MADHASVQLLAIYGSPRHGGNSDTLLDAALDGAASAGAVIQRVRLRDLLFAPCQNCGACSAHGVCHIKDDMASVYDELDHADVILLSSPIYFCSLCAQAKSMIERCQPYWARKFVLAQKPRKERRVGGFVCCCGFNDDRFLKCTEQIVKTWYFVMDVKYHGCCFVPGLDAMGSASRNPAAKEKAFDYGKALAGSASPPTASR